MQSTLMNLAIARSQPEFPGLAQPPCARPRFRIPGGCRFGNLSAVAALLGFLTGAALAADRPELLIADFEGDTYGDWKVTGQAFGPGPARGTLPGQMAVDGFQGKGLVNSFYQGDDSTGTLTSPPFNLERTYVRFLIGGGQHPGKACLNLLVNGEVKRTATGPNDRPGGSERLDWAEWDVREFAGQRVTLEIVDQAKGSWGHLNVDHILQTDQRLPGWIKDARRELTINRRYLNLPVKNGAPRRWVTLLIDGQPARQFEIELAETEPDWWAFLDLTPFQGERALLTVDRVREGSAGWLSIEQSDTLKGAADLYRERLRPQFHFSSRRGWNNDPNGLVFFQGEYHLFYQHNPYGWNWGNMHWGHAVSPDLVHWQELGDALYPDDLGTMFSGSAVVDAGNTTGFGTAAAPPLICMYTAAGNTSHRSQGRRFTQCLAYSTDRGRTWTSYEKNPVLGHVAGDNRDPKAFWYAPEHKWVMALYLDGHDFALFESPDLKEWKRMSDVKIEGTSECPEFFPMPLDGDRGQTRWVFYGGNGRYLVGGFDGRKFTPASGPHPLNFGNCFYASQTYNDIPESDGRRILVGWGQVALPGMPFNQMMTFPVELTLRTTGAGPRLYANPAREIEKLRVKTHRVAVQGLEPGANPLAAIPGELFDLTIEFEPGKASRVTVRVRDLPVVYDVQAREVICRDRKGPLAPVDGRVRLRLLVDRVSVEIFGNEGQLYMPMTAVPEKPERGLALSAEGGAAQITALEVHELKSIWP